MFRINPSPVLAVTIKAHASSYEKVACLTSVVQSSCARSSGSRHKLTVRFEGAHRTVMYRSLSSGLCHTLYHVWLYLMFHSSPPFPPPCLTASDSRKVWKHRLIFFTIRSFQNHNRILKTMTLSILKDILTCSLVVSLRAQLAHIHYPHCFLFPASGLPCKAYARPPTHAICVALRFDAGQQGQRGLSREWHWHRKCEGFWEEAGWCVRGDLALGGYDRAQVLQAASAGKECQSGEFWKGLWAFKVVAGDGMECCSSSCDSVNHTFIKLYYQKSSWTFLHLCN